MVVHNYPSSRHDNKPCHVLVVLVIYWTCSFQIQAFLLQEGHLLLVGRWVFLQSVASTSKCFSLQHIWSKWSLIAHWRMHDIRCLQTWNNHVLSLLEIVCCGHFYLPPCWTKLKFSSHIWRCPIFIYSCHLCNCEILYLFYWYIRFCYCLLHEISCFPCTVDMHRNRS